MELKLLALGLLQLVVANPTSPLQGLQDMQMVDDTESVGTYVRAVRATAVRISNFFYYFIRFLLLTSFYKNKEPVGTYLSQDAGFQRRLRSSFRSRL